MINILLSGCSGKMGKAIVRCAEDYDDIKIINGVDVYCDPSLDFKVYGSFKDVQIRPDVIIDFSSPAVLNDMLFYAVTNNVPIVICTTGYDEQQVQSINNISNHIPVFYSGNMSLGINVLIDLVKKAASVFGKSFDVEIIEKHHNQKVDAPSGTALMIADAIESERDESELVYDRHEVRKKRDKKEIGMHSVRGGTIVGEHEVIFAGHDEVVSVKHQAQSKDVFANGAINAARFIAGREPRMYQMSDLLK